MKVIIERGVSGSGKSTHAKATVKGVESSIICSADQYFIQNGVYNFDHRQLTSAHSYCRGKYEAALELGVEVVVVDNTNTQKWEYEQYVKTAEDAGYEVELNIVGSLDDDSLKVYANRNSHGVPLDSIRKQAKRFQK